MLMIAVQMALYYGNHIIRRIVEFLFVDAWDIENSYNLQSLLWHRPTQNKSGLSIDLGLLFQSSRRISALGQAIKADEIHNIVRGGTYLPIESPSLKVGDIFKFFINQGADIEWRGSPRMDTALLVAADSDSLINLRVMQELLWLDADYSAVDYKGRGPLHLALKPTRMYTGGGKGPFNWEIKDKLVHLLRAGCSIHAVDDYGRTPTDVARSWRRTRAWEAALQQVGKLECARLECQCEIIVSLPQAFRLSEKGLRLLRKTVTDAQLTYAENRYFPILQCNFVGNRP